MKRLLAMVFGALTLLAMNVTGAAAQTCTSNEDVTDRLGTGPADRECTEADYEQLFGAVYTEVGGVVITPGANPQPLPPQAQTPPRAKPQPQPSPRSQVLGTTQTRGSLVRTGLEAAPFAAAGAALVGAGAVLVMGARKRPGTGIPA